jgi:tRNA (guanine37-N1)-methyltransferase
VKIAFVSLFPEHITPWATSSMIGRAANRGLIDVESVNPRNFTYDRNNKVDDTPFGGEPGMLIKAEPVALAVQSLGWNKPNVILTDPAGKSFQQSDAIRLSAESELVFLCGHYEGIDDRAAEYLNAERFSIGDYILTSGELAAMVMADAIVRNLPGVLGDSNSLSADSHSDGLLSAPNYTKPEIWRGIEVPPVLRSGNHREIIKWRRQQALRITLENRPDLLAKAELTAEDVKLISSPDKT